MTDTPGDNLTNPRPAERVSAEEARARIAAHLAAIMRLAAAAGIPLPPAVAPQAQPNRRGRRPTYDAAGDRRLADAWDTGRYETWAEVAREFGVTESQARRCLWRVRKRAARAKGCQGQ